MLGAFSGARREPLDVVPINRDVVLEGRSPDGDIGAFRGRLLGTALAPAKGRDIEDPLFLVDDPDKPAPVWVRGSDVQRSRSGLAAGESVIGYVTVGGVDEPQAVAAIEAVCRRGGWRLAEIVNDRDTVRALKRPGLSYALEEIAQGRARGLVVNDLQRLTRSPAELGMLLEWFRDTGATFVALDLGLDTGTARGEEFAAMLIMLGGWQRERIAERTRTAMARIKAEGGTWGRPSVSDRPELFKRIADMRQAGMTLQAIADRLNAENVPTTRGGKRWWPSSVQAALGYRRPAARNRLPSVQPEEEDT